MYRLISSIAIIVVLALTIQSIGKNDLIETYLSHNDFDFLSKHLDASSRNGIQGTGRRLFKRQYAPVLPGYATNGLGACDYSLLHTCDAYSYGITQSGIDLQRTVSYVQQRKLFVGGLVSLSSLQSGGMCVPNSNLFTANAFSALTLGHITLPQLATLSLFPVQGIDMNGLANAGYISSYGQANILTGLGLQASIFGHIAPTQLQALNLYPLQGSALSAETLMQAGYLTSSCIPTALAISAIHIRYLPSNSFSSLGCQSADYSQVSITQLTEAKYVYGASNILTPVGLAAIRTGFFTKETFQRLGVFPFNVGLQGQSVEYAYQETQTQTSVVINDLVQIGYLQPNSYLLTNSAYYAITKGYFSIDNFRGLNIWPFAGTPTMNMFISAGYATYSGHLTSLGYSLLHAQYFPYDWLPRLGIHLHDDFQIFHQALHYGGYFRSDYNLAHTSMHTTSVSRSVDVAQVRF